MMAEYPEGLWPVDVPIGEGYAPVAACLAPEGMALILPSPEQSRRCRAQAGECKGWRVGNEDFCIGHLRKIQAEEKARSEQAV